MPDSIKFMSREASSFKGEEELDDSRVILLGKESTEYSRKVVDRDRKEKILQGRGDKSG